MKTQYFRRTKRFLSPQYGLFIVIAAVLFLILAGLRFLAPGAFTALFTPLWGAGTSVTGAIEGVGDAPSLAAEVERLTAENETLRNENQALVAGAEAAVAGITAGVIARPPLAPYDILIVGKGERDGVYARMQVFSKGIPVGTVESVAPGSARVALYSSSGRASEGWVGENRIPITLTGRGAGAFSADVPREAGIVEGDAVYLPGPGGLPVGSVVRVESNASSPRATVRVRPIANPFTMTSVVIAPAPPL